MISCCFFFNSVKFYFKKKHSTLWIYDRKNMKSEWLINYGITIAKLLICWAQERRFRLWNPIILQPQHFRAPQRRSGGLFRLTLTPDHCASVTRWHIAYVNASVLLLKRGVYSFRWKSATAKYTAETKTVVTAINYTFVHETRSASV